MEEYYKLLLQYTWVEGVEGGKCGNEVISLH